MNLKKMKNLAEIGEGKNYKLNMYGLIEESKPLQKPFGIFQRYILFSKFVF